ncbi:hypothetical protein EMPG_10452 [Blastomyces silverae]|uniref:Uncharacterized protein n=1 Tax=Blastomyces silverae TaxID=2060906 RepID=A0A0H1B402_9EURO|nr:hypothetical protein EMPG_10452 [Blastomyces silverae]
MKDGDVHELLETLNAPQNGFGHLGGDGVFRVFDKNGTVIDYLALDNGQINDMIDGSGRKEKDKDHMRKVLDGVDGTEVSLQQIWEPPEHLLPPRLKDPKALQRRGQRPPLRSRVPGGLKDPPHPSGVSCQLATVFELYKGKP